MRLRAVLAAAAMLAIATPSVASEIVQNLSAVEDFGGDFAPYSIDGAAFNPAQGTLTGVTATLTGSYTPIIDLSGEGGIRRAESWGQAITRIQHPPSRTSFPAIRERNSSSRPAESMMGHQSPLTSRSTSPR